MALDIDGTITGAPKIMKFLVDAWRKAGGEVHILTATKNEEATTADYTARKAQLKELGIPYDELYIAVDPIATNKCKYLKTVGANFYLDNRAKNAVLAATVTNSCLFLGDNADDSETDIHDAGG